MERVIGQQEYLDGALRDDVLTGNLRDLVKVNRWLGGADLSRRAIAPLARPGRPMTVLDVGTGAADIPLYLAQTLDSGAFDIDLRAIDIRPEIVEIARAWVGNGRVEVRRGRLEDEVDRSHSVVHASLVLHHLDPPEAQRFLAEMARVARDAVVINDLDRARRWLIGARVMTALLSRNEYTRHDGPLSVQRAYRPEEVVALAERAGLVEAARYWARPRYRYALVFRHTVLAPQAVDD